MTPMQLIAELSLLSSEELRQHVSLYDDGECEVDTFLGIRLKGEPPVFVYIDENEYVVKDDAITYSELWKALTQLPLEQQMLQIKVFLIAHDDFYDVAGIIRNESDGTDLLDVGHVLLNW